MTYPLWVNLAFPIPVKRECVWRVLTEPSLTQQYMYNCRLHSTWSIGSIVEWVSEDTNGIQIPQVRGKLLECRPHQCLRFKIFHEKIGKKHHSELQFKIIPITPGIILNIKQGDFTHFPEAEKTFKACLNGWEYIRVNLIKTCLATPTKN